MRSTDTGQISKSSLKFVFLVTNPSRDTLLNGFGKFRVFAEAVGIGVVFALSKLHPCLKTARQDFWCMCWFRRFSWFAHWTGGLVR